MQLQQRATATRPSPHPETLQTRGHSGHDISAPLLHLRSVHVRARWRGNKRRMRTQDMEVREREQLRGRFHLVCIRIWENVGQAASVFLKA